MSWDAILGFRLVTADLDRAVRFYAALGFGIGNRRPIESAEMALLGVGGHGLRQGLEVGTARVELDWFADAGRPYPVEADAAALLFQHFALVTDDATRDWALAEQAGATPISRQGPVTLPRSAGGVTAVKFRDPDGHPLELIQFPDAAARGWRGAGLLGIDHSAVSVADLEVSERFFTGRGLSVGLASLNTGPAQVDLDGLDGVEVGVVPMIPAVQAAPHLELLGYRQPRGRRWGQPATADQAATRIVWRAGCNELVRDPDGHLHQLTL